LNITFDIYITPSVDDRQLVLYTAHCNNVITSKTLAKG